MRPYIFALLLSQVALANGTEDVLDVPQQTREIALPASVVAANTDADTAPASYRVAQAFSSTSWFDTVDLEMSKDLDNDRYYSRLYVKFDAHTQKQRQDVYAVYSLINDRNQLYQVHTSAIFSLFGASRTDYFAIDMSLTSIPRDIYKLRIQLRDAATGALLAELSGNDTSSLSRLYLESASTDGPPPVVIVEERHGGSIGIFAVAALSLLWVSRRFLVKKSKQN
jgi:hypothetical protein